MENVAIDAGQELEEVHFTLGSSMVRQYTSVIDDRSAIYGQTDLVPMTAVAALGIRTLLEGLGLPPGAVHVAQELESHGAARIEQEVSCRARVAQVNQRRDSRFVALEFTVLDGRGYPILEGRTILLVPGRGG